MKTYKTRIRLAASISLSILVAYYYCLPRTLFNTPTATVVFSKQQDLLGATIARDGQWRFPKKDNIAPKFKSCIIAFEDAYFYLHQGYNPFSMARAMLKNIKAKKVVQGGSTISQQVIRISRKNPRRSYIEKLLELILATRLELRYSKEQILAFYCANAPFGGNTVGLEMAAWRYFKKKPEDLSWAQSATLAVLPNAPGLIFPGKNQKKLKQKRDKLLLKLLQNKTIDSLSYTLAKTEPLPQKPHAVPNIAPHFTQQMVKKHAGKKIHSTLDTWLQKQTNAIVKKHYEHLKKRNIYNIGVCIIETKNHKIRAYVGNSPTDKAHQKNVDIITSARSTGSILKPFLYTAMLDHAEILPHTLLPDIPIKIANYSPTNFTKRYDGAVAASKALARSLNVPAVKMLQQFGVVKFHDILQKMQLKDISYTPNHYGLSLILGGAESTLLDITKSYASMGRTLMHYNQNDSQYFSKEFTTPIYLEKQQPFFGEKQQNPPVFSAGSIYLTLEALKEVHRPQGEENWIFFDSKSLIGWKTGTSYGHRDAWAVGTTPTYTIGVWVGNANGLAKPDITGVKVAAPILFDILKTLPTSNWFNSPLDDLIQGNICTKSGYKASPICHTTKKAYLPIAGQKTKLCPYHKWVHLDQQEKNQVTSNCYPIEKMKHKSWFVLPALMAHYYQQNNPEYQKLPDFMANCAIENQKTMAFIYPKANTRVIAAKDFNGKKNPIILQVAHKNKKANLYWYKNKTYLGRSSTFHEMALAPIPGSYTIQVLDDTGNSIKKTIEIQ